MPPPTTTPGPDSPAAVAPKGRAPHRRNEQARVAVLHAADDLLAERGFAGVTIEGIATRAGVAKQTIYRWWPSKVEVLLDTLIEDSQEKPGPAGDRLGDRGRPPVSAPTGRLSHRRTRPGRCCWR